MKETVTCRLQELIPHYAHNKLEYDSYKKIVDKDNKEIKELMIANDLDSFECDGIIASCSISERLDFNEDMLLAKIKELGIPGIIQQKEYVDMDALESAIYNGQISAIELAPCQIKKEVATLRINTRKDL